jgi:uncharacterized LabA/DUF88 family protein
MKTYIQLDVQNLFFAAKDIDKRIDFLRIRDFFFKQEKNEVVGITAYIVRSPDASSNKFEGFLRSIGYELNIKRAQLGIDIEGRRIYKGTDHDIGICIDCMRRIDTFDKWVLMSGDGDFIDLCKYLKEKGKFVEVWSLPGLSFNKGFCNYANIIRFLDDSFFYEKSEVDLRIGDVSHEEPRNNISKVPTAKKENIISENPIFPKENP